MQRAVVVAPDKFKGSLSAIEAAAAIERGLRAVLGADLAARIVPMADGGEGTVDAFVAGGARKIVRTVPGPLGREVDAAFALDAATAVIEMSAASGLGLVAEAARDPLRASTYGTGELVRAVLALGAERIVVGIGGSATNDGGAGLLQALGVRLLDAEGRDLEPGGGALAQLARIDLAQLDPRLRGVAVDVAADVDNPLLGERGASAIFGPQKGATGEDVERLERALANFARRCAEVLGRDVREVPGTGAAGGLGFALHAFFDARLRPGVEIVAELRGLGRALADAASCWTGEGSIDRQTLGGKTVAGVTRIARAARVPTFAFGGRVEAEAESELARLGAVAVPIADGPRTLESSLRDAASLLERAAARTARGLIADGGRV